MSDSHQQREIFPVWLRILLEATSSCDSTAWVQPVLAMTCCQVSAEKLVSQEGEDRAAFGTFSVKEGTPVFWRVPEKPSLLSWQCTSLFTGLNNPPKIISPKWFQDLHGPSWLCNGLLMNDVVKTQSKEQQAVGGMCSSHHPFQPWPSDFPQQWVHRPHTLVVTCFLSYHFTLWCLSPCCLLKGPEALYLLTRHT